MILFFGDQRNIDCLVQVMIVMKPNENESFITFVQRIQRFRSSITSKLKSFKTLTHLNVQKTNISTFKIKIYDELELKNFRDLTRRIQDITNPDRSE